MQARQIEELKAKLASQYPASEETQEQ
jgi:hypothetical protein